MNRLKVALKLEIISMPTRLSPPPASITSEVDQSADAGEYVIEQIRIFRLHSAGDPFIWCRARSHKFRDADGHVSHQSTRMSVDWISDQAGRENKRSRNSMIK